MLFILVTFSFRASFRWRLRSPPKPGWLAPPLTPLAPVIYPWHEINRRYLDYSLAGYFREFPRLRFYRIVSRRAIATSTTSTTTTTATKRMVGLVVLVSLHRDAPPFWCPAGRRRCAFYCIADPRWFLRSHPAGARDKLYVTGRELAILPYDSRAARLCRR